MRVSTDASFRAASKRIRELRKIVEAQVPDVSPALMIAHEIRTDVIASRPGAGVPRDKGDLAASVEANGGGRGIMAQATVSAGGASAPYALIQHERLDYHHDLGEARYLVRAVERWTPNGSQAMKALGENVQAAIRAAAE